MDWEIGRYQMLKRYYTIKVILSLLLIGSFSVAHSQEKGRILTTISIQKAADLMRDRKDDTNFIILDVRTPAEYKNGHLKNAVLLDFYSKDFIEKLKGLDKRKAYLLYCRSGNRSGKTLNLIKGLGFEEVYHMSQGMIGWRSKGFPISRMKAGGR